ncbi:MAG: ATP-binding protein [Planctomycetota bacterium]|jgi:signal transduction histidine kinase
MGFINLAEKTISAKLVYYGCGMGGKTTSLKAVHETMCPRNEVQLVSINTEEDATLLFDFLPIDIGEVEVFKIRIQGFTVPGQPKYRRMRKYVLSGADAVVFVVDSESSRLEENLDSMDNLKENLALNGLSHDSIPLVLQYNKRDLDDILSEEELDEHFRFNDQMAAFPSVATESRGVFETFVHATGLLVEEKVRLYGLGKGEIDPAVVAEGARQKLWKIHDELRSAEEKEAEDERPNLALTFDEEGRKIDPDLDFDEDPSLQVLPEGEILTDEDLEIELCAEGQVLDFEPKFEPEEGPEPALLDAAVESNLELVERFGELDRYKSLLEKKNKELVEVTQNVVHDLNRPLSAIRLMLSSMRQGILGDLGDRMGTAVDTGLSAVQHMERLIRDLMDSSRLDYDGVALEFQQIDMTLLVAQIVSNFRYEIEENNVGVRIVPLPMLQGDEWALTKALTNIIGNAIQYGHPERPQRIWISCEEEGGRWVIVIRDNGIGIPADDRPRLYQRFERGANTGGISGTGLGLHIVNEIILGHGGEVWVESEEGKGSAFFLAIPKEPEQPPHSAVSEIERVSVS